MDLYVLLTLRCSARSFKTDYIRVYIKTNNRAWIQNSLLSRSPEFWVAVHFAKVSAEVNTQLLVSNKSEKHLLGAGPDNCQQKGDCYWQPRLNDVGLETEEIYTVVWNIQSYLIRAWFHNVVTSCIAIVGQRLAGLYMDAQVWRWSKVGLSYLMTEGSFVFHGLPCP